jgi:hypothetical protein
MMRADDHAAIDLSDVPRSRFAEDDCPARWPEGQHLDLHGKGRLACRIAEALAEKPGTMRWRKVVSREELLRARTCDGNLNHRK